MAFVVTGLSSTGDTSGLRSALIAAGMPTDSLQVISPDEAATSVARGVIGAELYTHEGGTGVPGLNNNRTGTAFFRGESLPDRLGDLEIPDSEVGNYLEALSRGKSIVAYFAQADTIDRIEGLFREVALANVRRF